MDGYAIKKELDGEPVLYFARIDLSEKLNDVSAYDCAVNYSASDSINTQGGGWFSILDESDYVQLLSLLLGMDISEAEAIAETEQ